MLLIHLIKKGRNMLYKSPFKVTNVEKTYNDLTQAYRFFRNVEHRIQMVNDTQSHQLPKSEEGLIWVIQKICS